MIDQHNNEFIIDSGASHSIVNNKHVLINLTPMNNSYIKTAGNHRLVIESIGELQLGLLGKIENVLYVPQARKNLLSVRQITEDNKDLRFSNDKVFLKCNGIETKIGQLSNNLYVVSNATNNENDFEAHNIDLKLPATLDLLHRRFAHADINKIKEIIRLQLVDNIEIKPHEAYKDYHCESCAMAKATKTRLKSSPWSKLTNKFPGESLDIETIITDINLVSDVVGPFPPSITNHRYIITFSDRSTKYRWTYLMHSKDEAFQKFKLLHAELKSLKLNISTLRSDNGGEFTSHEFSDYLVSESIIQRFTPPHTPNANSMAERFNRTLLGRIRAMLHGARLPMFIWSEACQTATMIYNMLPWTSENGVTQSPHQRLFGTTPDASKLRSYGCVAYAYNFSNSLTKLDNRALKGCLVGYDKNSATYRIYLPSQHKLIRSGHVKFNEHQLYYEKPLLSDPYFISNNDQLNLVPLPKTSAQITRDVNHNNHNDEEVNTPIEVITEVEEIPVNSNENNITTRPARERMLPKYLTDYVTFLANANIVTNDELDELENVSSEFINEPLEADDVPRSFIDIAHRTDCNEWLDSINDENSSISQHNVFIEVDSLPHGQIPLKAKYVFTVKDNGRKKSRLVIKGYSQVKGVNYEKTYAPVIGKTTLRFLFSLAATLDLEIFQLDVKTAFLHGELSAQEEIYMNSIEGMPYPKGTLLKLNKSLYGLKQGSRVWYLTLKEFVHKAGFSQSLIDRGLFFIVIDGDRIYVAIYVDDILIFGKNITFINKFKLELGRRFNIEDLGVAKYFLGMEIERDRTKRTIKLTQRRYLAGVIAKYGAANDVSSYRVPITKSTLNCIVNKDSGAAEIASESVPYRNLLGALLYANTCTRPDLTYAISILSSFTTTARIMHWNALKDVLNYVKRTIDVGITFGNVTQSEIEKLVTYADSDWAPAHTMRRSRTGFVIFLNGAPITWKSKLQSITAGSSSEAELYAMYDATMQALQLRELSRGCFKDIPLINHEDNSGCLDWMTNMHSASASRMKGIETKFYRLQELADNNEVSFIKIPTEYQRADSFTKLLEGSTFDRQFDMLYNNT